MGRSPSLQDIARASPLNTKQFNWHLNSTNRFLMGHYDTRYKYKKIKKNINENCVLYLVSNDVDVGQFDLIILITGCGYRAIKIYFMIKILDFLRFRFFTGKV